MVSVVSFGTPHQHSSHPFGTCTHESYWVLLLQMADWTFRQVLLTIRSPPSIPTSVLESSVGLCLGDICFAELHTTLKMCMVSLALLERLVTDGSFNLECKAESDYSHTTAIALALIPDAKLKDIEKVGIRLVVCRYSGVLAGISSVQEFIKNIWDALK